MSTRLISLCLFLSAPLSLSAQNLLNNPGFDTGTQGWATSQYTDWSNTQDHDGDGFGTGGSVHMSSTSQEYAQQCVTVLPDRRYVLDLWIQKDPNPLFAPCSGANWFFQATFWDDTACHSTQIGAMAPVIQLGLPDPDGWFNKRISGITPTGTRAAQVELFASCNANNGVAIYYFDDVSLQPDEIFPADFE